MRGGFRPGAGRKGASLRGDSVVGGFVMRNGLSQTSAADVLGCSRGAVRRWCRNAPPPLTVVKMVAALDAMADAGLPWPGALQPDRRPEPKFPLLYPRGSPFDASRDLDHDARAR